MRQPIEWAAQRGGGLPHPAGPDPRRAKRGADAFSTLPANEARPR